ncbi:sugar nucleotide-binding protein [Dictyobacter kobayashii]|uniref:sugar nucleotide-binding protein n=1 Tax=Dictyobacter kobayashii TaxID=2014872 RepID=UPI0024822BA0|nr:sugar nucleotide-binding protein [Dictyobacter kobayashii]
MYHTAGACYIDRWGFARQIAQALSLNMQLLQPVLTASLNQIARRPLRNGLLCQRIFDELGIQPLSLQEAILRVKQYTNQLTL